MGDIEALRGELLGFVEEHTKWAGVFGFSREADASVSLVNIYKTPPLRFESYMERLTHAYKKLQAESSKVFAPTSQTPDKDPPAFCGDLFLS